MQLHAIDWGIIVGYLLLTLAIGLYFRGRAGQSVAEYFISGRSLPWWIAGTSMVATTFAADTPLAVTGLVAENGLAGNWVWWSFALGGMITVFVYARLWRRAEVMTDVELIELRYGGRPAAALRCIRAVYVALVINPIIIGWVTQAMVTVLKQTVLFQGDGVGSSGGHSDWLIIGTLLVVVGIYCTLSGMWGVAMTDFVQFFAAMIGCVLLTIVAVNHLGGIEQLQAKFIERYPDGEQAFRFLPDVNAESAWMPLHVFLIFLLVQWWATWYPGAEPGGGGYVVQRMASCKNEKHAVMATLWFQIAHYCIRPWPWLIVAFAAVAIYPDLRELALDKDLREATNLTPGVGFARVIRDLSPTGLRGLMLVTFFAAFMSTISTQMNWGASYLVRDVYQRFLRPDATEKELTNASRAASVLVLIVGGLVSAWMVEANIPIDDAWKMLLALGAGTGAVFMLRWFWWRINAWSEISAMAASLVFYLVVKQYSGQLDFPLRDSETIAIVAFATIVTWLGVTFVTQAESNQKLIEFYRKVRPGGPGWKPMADEAPEVQVDKHVGLCFLTAIVASGVVYFTLPAVGAIIFGDHQKGALLLVGAGVCAAAMGVMMRMNQQSLMD